VVVAPGKTRNAVVWVGDDAAAGGETPHVERIVGDFAADLGIAGANLALRIRMQDQVDARRRRGRLSGVVVGRVADAAAAEDDVAAGEAATQDVRQTLAIVAVIQRPVERQPARGEQLDDFGEMLVLTTAKGDFVTDDDRADTIACCTHKTTPLS
jgi:hypothetical protein